MLLANVVGALVYVRMAAYSWAVPAERAAGVTTVAGEPFVWFFGVAPVLGVFAVANLTWVAVARRRRPSVGLGLAVCAVWAAAVLADFAHH